MKIICLIDVFNSSNNCLPETDLLSWEKNGNTLVVNELYTEILGLNNTTLQVRLADSEESNLFYYVELVK